MKELSYTDARKALKQVVERDSLIAKLAERAADSLRRHVEKKGKITPEFLKARLEFSYGVIDEFLKVIRRSGYTVSANTRQSLAEGLQEGFFTIDALSRRAELLRPDRSPEHAPRARKKGSDGQWD